jgi:uncharacterized protein (DUF1330 family)
MAAYFVIEPKDVVDPAGAEEYNRLVQPMIARWGGRYVARGAETVEGDWHPRSLVIIEFASLERLKAFYASEEYAPLMALRQRCTRMNAVIVPGT